MQRHKSISSMILLLLGWFCSLSLIAQNEPLPTDFFEGEEPKVINMDEIKLLIGYPPMAKEANIQGRVVVRVLVDESGNYVKHIVLKDPHPILTKPVCDALPRFRFTPANLNGKACLAWLTLPFEFKLNYGGPSYPDAFKHVSLKVKLLTPSNAGSREISPPSLASQERELAELLGDGAITGPTGQGGTAVCTVTISKKGETQRDVNWVSAKALDARSVRYIEEWLAYLQWIPADKNGWPKTSKVELTFLFW